MTWNPSMRPRPDQPSDGDERSVLLRWLEFHRETLATKCAGLSREQLATKAVPPSTTSLLGLVRHLTEMERAYFVLTLGGGPFQLVYCTDEDPEADFDGVADADPGEVFAAWHRERAHADELIAGIASLGQSGRDTGGRSLRWCLVKVLQEYARHNGHADLLRQCIDGAVGE